MKAPTRTMRGRELDRLAKACDITAAISGPQLSSVSSAARCEDAHALRNALARLQSYVAKLSLIAQGAERVLEGGSFEPRATDFVTLEGFEIGVAVTRGERGDPGIGGGMDCATPDDDDEIEVVSLTVTDWSKALEFVSGILDSEIAEAVG